jgi:hypothetical protein
MSAAQVKPQLVKAHDVNGGFYYPRASANLLSNIPHKMTVHKSWVVWAEAPGTSGRKYKKMPQNPMTRSGEDWNNSRNWSHRAVATELFERDATLRGIGFAFSVNDPFTFFDLDGVIIRGKLLPWAAEFAKTIDSYTEISNSGTGIKIIVEAKLGDRGNTLMFVDSNGEQHEVEVYDRNRFFAATGNRLESTPRDIANRQELLDTLHPPVEDQEDGPPIERSTDEYAKSVDAIADEKLISTIIASKGGMKFQRLMNGNMKGYAGQFTASGALCRILGFWTRANPERIDRIYRQSKLYDQDWWDEEHTRGKSRAQYVIDSACRKAAAKPMYTPRSTGLITDDNGRVLPILANVITVLRQDPKWDGVIGLNEFSLYAVARKETPWGKRVGENWTDADDLRITEWMQRRGIMINPQTAANAVQAIAEENRFHPVKDYLRSLIWDGANRIDAWLTTYLGVAETAFTKAIGARWLISAIARIYQPGCQADYTLMLEGPQGAGKSTALRKLAGTGWFTDHISDLDSKDSRIELHGVWIVELAELSAIKRSSVERVKGFLTAVTDHFRPPYGRRTMDVPRTNVFAGSVNDAESFTDPTGSRRFWPVSVGKIDVAKIVRDRDQLWAETLVRYKADAVWWLDTDELNKSAAEEQEERYEPGVWDQQILRYIENPLQREEEEWSTDSTGKKECVMTPMLPFDSKKGAVTITDILIHGIGKELDRLTQGDRNQVARCLTHAGWKVDRVRTGQNKKGPQLRIYKKEMP